MSSCLLGTENQDKSFVKLLQNWKTLDVITLKKNVGLIFHYFFEALILSLALTCLFILTEGYEIFPCKCIWTTFINLFLVKRTLHIKLFGSHKLKSAKYLTSFLFPLVPYFFVEVCKCISESALYDSETPNLEECLWVQSFVSNTLPSCTGHTQNHQWKQIRRQRVLCYYQVDSLADIWEIYFDGEVLHWCLPAGTSSLLDTLM